MLRPMALLFLVTVPAFVLAESEPQAEKAKLTIEFRRAETESAEGLQETVVRGTMRKIYLYPKPDVTLSDVEEVAPGRISNDRPAVSIKLTKKGAEKMRKLTESNIGKPLAIVVNGEVVLAPIIRERLSNKLMISGLKQAEADEIVELFEDR